MAINALNSGARVWLADLEDANTPHWRNVVEGQVNLADAVRRTIAFTSPEGKGYPLDGPRPPAGDPAPATRLAPRRGAPDAGRQAAGRRARRLRAVLLPQRRRAALARQRSVLLPAQDGVPPRGPALERRVHATPSRSWGSRTGSVRATVLIETITAAFEMEEILWELRDHVSGLNAGRWDYLFSIIKNFRDADGVHPPRPQRDHHGRADDAGVRRPAGADLPPAGRLRDGRDGGVHPVPTRRGGQRGGVREGPRGQDTRGARRLRRLVGGAPRPRAGLRRDLRRRARRRQPGRPAARRRPRLRRRPARGRRHARRADHGRAAAQHQRGHRLRRRLAGRQRRGRDPQPHGGRRHRRDLPLADLAVDAPARPRWRPARR